MNYAEQIRDDFETALKQVDNGSELSSILGWGFYANDLTNLAIIHRENPELRRKIEDLLTDCNFHSECNAFKDGKYDNYISDMENGEELA